MKFSALLFGTTIVVGAILASESAGAAPQARTYPCAERMASLETDQAIFVDTPNTAGLSIFAYDMAGQPVTGALVHLRSAERDADTTTTTVLINREGMVTMTTLRPQSYRITVAMVSKETSTQDIRLTAATTDSLCFVLRTRKLREMHLRGQS